MSFKGFDMEISSDTELFKQLREKLDTAERHINHVENIEAGLDIPSINELRYAFNHLLRHLCGEEDGRGEALKHIRRAIYDCYETEAIFSFKMFAAFETDFQDQPIIAHVPDYLDWARKFASLQKFMAETPHDNREGYYVQLEQELYSIRPLLLSIKVARQELLKIATKSEDELRRKDEEMASAKARYQDELRRKDAELAIAKATLRVGRWSLAIAGALAIISALGWMKSTGIIKFSDLSAAPPPAVTQSSTLK